QRNVACSIEHRRWQGRGTCRRNHALSMTVSPSLITPSLRLATATDVLLYFEWANDPDVRKMSFDGNSIPIDAHRIWFARKLESPDVLMLVLEAPSPVGQIRFDVANDVALIGFSLARRARGRGLGSYLLRQGCHHLLSRYPDVRTARGLVKAANIASRRAFEAAGFHVSTETWESGVPALTYDIDVAQSTATSAS